MVLASHRFVKHIASSTLVKLFQILDIFVAAQDNSAILLTCRSSPHLTEAEKVLETKSPKKSIT
uniref:Uncharacterized protein n=1 Tax=Parascaris equorum TaxID=6256 RepID=A0A914RPY3_PAREQ